MKRIILQCMFMAAIGCLCLPVVFGQKVDQNVTTADKYVISAEAGGVSWIQGDITVSRPDGTGGPLVSGDRLKTGDKVTSGSVSRAEIMLNPGSHLRIAGDSAFQFRSTTLDDLRIKLDKGSAIFEVFATNQFRISVFTPKGRVTILDSGVFRFDLSAGVCR